MLKIGEFSKLSRVSIRLLRQYDEDGLLAPAAVDPGSGYRYYSEDQLSTAGRITALRDMGFTRPAIREALRRWENPAALEEYLLFKRAEAQETRQEAERRLRLLDTALARLRKDETMEKYEITVKTIPARTVASVRQIIPSYGQEGDLWSIYCQETAGMQIQEGDPRLCAAIYHDGEFREADVDVEIQKTVTGTYPDTAHVKFKTEPPVEAATAVFRGSYSQIPQVNQAVAAWIAENGYELAGKFFNIYHVGPYEKRNPEEFVTEVCYPVRKK